MRFSLRLWRLYLPLGRRLPNLVPMTITAIAQTSTVIIAVELFIASSWLGFRAVLQRQLHCCLGAGAERSAALWAQTLEPGTTACLPTREGGFCGRVSSGTLYTCASVSSWSRRAHYKAEAARGLPLAPSGTAVRRQEFQSSVRKLRPPLRDRALRAHCSPPRKCLSPCRWPQLWNRTRPRCCGLREPEASPKWAFGEYAVPPKQNRCQTRTAQIVSIRDRLQRELTRAVHRKARHHRASCAGTHVNQQSAALAPHRRQYRAVDAGDSKLVHIQQLLILFDRHGDALRGDSGVMDHHVDAPGAIQCLCTARFTEASFVASISRMSRSQPSRLARDRNCWAVEALRPELSRIVAKPYNRVEQGSPLQFAQTPCSSL